MSPHFGFNFQTIESTDVSKIRIATLLFLYFTMILIGNKIVLIYNLIATFFDIKYTKKSSIVILMYTRLLEVLFNPMIKKKINLENYIVLNFRRPA